MVTVAVGPGDPAPDGPRSGRAQRTEAGYTLVGLMIVVVVVNLSLTVAVTSWRTVDRRAREAELIWRGEQIVQAIACYRAQQSAGPLERLEQLVQASCLRRQYRDPMSRDGGWRLIRRSELADGTVAAMLGIAAESTPAAAAASGADLASRLARPQAGTGLAARASDNSIIGVVTASPGPALRLYRGEADTGRWLFLAEGLPGTP